MEPSRRSDEGQDAVIREIRDRLTHVPGVVSVHHRQREGVHEVIVVLDRHDRTIEHIVVEIERSIIVRFPGERFDFRVDTRSHGSMDAFLGWTEAARVVSSGPRD